MRTVLFPGQRWINNAEPDLGLGMIMDIQGRTINVMFPGSGETRSYAMHNMPLVRATFKSGDDIKCQDIGTITIDRVEERDGLLIYHGKDKENQPCSVPETRLDGMLKISQPLDRLLSKQLDKNRWFELRSQTLQLSNKLMHTVTRGLCGSRTSLLPHQLYIANEVGNRYQPRVLLADEVGLGKTIEAGMIVHQQLLKAQAKRILVVVPETLQHQWLVEMLRRFNLHFSLFDSERFDDAIDMEPDTNPFISAQLILCNLTFLLSDVRYKKAVLDGEWDLLIVDEAHHLKWNNNEGGDTGYQLIESLSRSTPGVLLLTATPEQLGKESHYARLRLLDQERFSHYEKFLQEEQDYQPIAELIELLLSNNQLNTDQQHVLDSLIPDKSALSTETEEQRYALIHHLLDHQGTGRMLFRNTRASIQGFPERLVYAYPLSHNNCYEKEELSQVLVEKNTPLSQDDPRIQWLLNFLDTHPNEKALLITSMASSVLQLAKVLKKKIGIHAAVFHEGMTIIERDRAAAYFADEEGSQLLLCSEIGGEGRNFQFAHHLILFELPANPDLLEQRIGRIDRIGQGNEIFIHVPYMSKSAQEVLYEWYYHGLQALQAPCPAAPKVYHLYKERLETFFNTPEHLSHFIAEVKQSTLSINEQLQDGRDKLLELNSYRRDIADDLVKKLIDEEDTHRLKEYMLDVFDCFGVDQEDHSPLSYVLHVGDSLSEPFPCLPDEGTTITFDRKTALQYEDMQFITWEHEMVVSVMDSILAKENGNVALTTFSHSSIEAGTFMLECLFVLDVTPQVKGYMSGAFIRTLLSEDNKDYSKALSPAFFKRKQQPVARAIAQKIIKAKETTIKLLTQRSQKYAGKQLTALIDQASKNVEQILGTEVQRLKDLQKVNPNVRDSEIEFLQQKLNQSKKELVNPTLRLDAIRVLIST